MNKNVKRMIFILSIITLFVAISAVSAADEISDDVTTADVQQVVDDNTNIQEEVSVQSTDNKVVKQTNNLKQDEEEDDGPVVIDNNVNINSGNIQTIQADSGNTIVGDNDDITPYPCTCGCMNSNQNSPDLLLSSPKNVKSDEEEDIVVISNDNWKPYTNARTLETPYALNKKNSLTGKTVVFAQDFTPSAIMVFGNTGLKAIKEIPLNTMTLGFVNGNWEVDGLYLPNTMITSQTTLKLTNTVARGCSVYWANNHEISNNTFIGENTVGSQGGGLWLC